MTALAQPHDLLDRDSEIGTIDRLLTSARGGAGGALVIRGESGTGKSALLAYAIASSLGMTVLRVTGVESEMGFALAALRLMIAPILNEIAALPSQEAAAVLSALNLTEGREPDRLALGVSLPSVLARAATGQPLLCVVEDSQWLDGESSEALGLMARRVDAEPIALLFSLLEPGEATPLEGLPSMQLNGLPEYASRDLLIGAVDGRLADNVRDRAVAELRGNPLALLELPAELTSAQLAGDAVLPRQLPLGAGLTQSVMRLVHALPADCRLFLLLVAAEPDADVDVVWRAAEQLGLTSAASVRAESEGLLKIGESFSFPSAFIRSAVYVSASAAERRRVHAALAATTDAETDPDRSAWHRAGAATGLEEGIADALERSADRGLDRGGYPRVALLLEQSAQQTRDAHRRADRYLLAVDAELKGGAADRAAAMLSEFAGTSELQRARMQELRVKIGIERGTSPQPAKALLAVAEAFEPLDARRARDAHLGALVAALLSGRFGSDEDGRAAARRAQAAPPAPANEVAADLLLDGLATLYAEGHTAAAPTLRRALEALRDEDDLALLRFGGYAAGELWDDEAIHELALRRVEIARARGALFSLRRSLNYLGAVYEVLAGRFDAAQDDFEEALVIARATRSPRADDRSGLGRLIVAAWRGRELEARLIAETTMRNATARGDGAEVSFAQNAIAVLELSLGRYAEAAALAREATGQRGVLCVSTWALPELVEAAARSGAHEEAAAAVERLADSALAGGTDWGLGMLARSRALVAEKRTAPALYEEAIERLGRSRSTPQLARARLVYGEWLRRSRLRKDAREHLRAAHQMFAAMGAEGFAERARSELAATGERTRRWTPQTMDLLTPQEARIALLVAEGASNSDVAAQLFISPRTVEYHLGKMFRKVGVASRTQLARALLGDRQETNTKD